MKLNGWVRMGIFASVVWFIWSYNNKYDRLEHRDGAVLVDKETRCVAEHTGRNKKFDDFFPECDALNPENLTVLHQNQRDDRIEAATEAAGVIPLAWGFALVVLLVGQWVMRGGLTPK